jgi:uncharacterized protein YuzE
MEKNEMSEFRVSYDEKEDILYLAKEGQEEEIVEIAPGVNAELDAAGNLLGVEIFEASKLLKDVIKSIENKALAA